MINLTTQISKVVWSHRGVNLMVMSLSGELRKPVLEVLEEGVNNESSPLSKLGRIWGSGIIKDKIIEELECYWAKLAHGRTLEEAARY